MYVFLKSNYLNIFLVNVSQAKAAVIWWSCTEENLNIFIKAGFMMLVIGELSIVFLTIGANLDASLV